MKRSAALAGLALLSIAYFTGGYNSGGLISDKFATLDKPKSSSYHTWYDHEYLEPGYFEPKATFVPIFHDGDSSFVRVVVAVWDSVRNSVGRFGDSTWGGVDLRATVGLITANVTADSSTAMMSVPEVKSLAGRQKFYEIATHGTDAERLGAIGLDADNAQVSFGGVTGRSKLFLQTALGIYQDSLVAWGVGAARSHVYANWRMTLGEQAVWRSKGYYQAAGRDVGAALAASTVQAGTNARQRNSDEYVPSVFGRTHAMYRGFHTIGERFDPFDIGMVSFNHGSSNGGRTLVDSVKVGVDMAYLSGDIYCVGFHRVANDTAAGDSSLTISKEIFYDLTYFLASRVAEGGLQLRTLEQAAAMMRGIRDLELVQHRGFKLFKDFTYTSNLAAGRDSTVPLGGFPALDAFGNFYATGADTFVAPGGTATNPKVLAFGTVDTVSADYAVTSSIDSLSYGAADTSANYIVMDMVATAGSRGLTNIIRVTGSKARALRVAVQTYQLGTPGWDADVYLNGKFGQFTEVWEDNVNSGGAAFDMMPSLVGTRTTAPDLTADLRVARVRPQFNPIPGDTTKTWPTTITDGDLPFSLLAAWLAPTLRPYWYSVAPTEWDHSAGFGNARSLTATTGTADDHDDNWQAMDKNNPVDHYFYVPINEESDYVYCQFQPSATVAMASAGTVVFLNISAQPVR